MHKAWRRILLVTALAAATSLTVVAAEAPWRIGFIGAVTGRGSFLCDPELKAARLRVKLINQLASSAESSSRGCIRSFPDPTNAARKSPER